MTTLVASPGSEQRIRDDRALLRRFKQAPDEATKYELADRFLPLARHVMLRHVNPKSPDFEDIEQVASLGLWKAIERFDPEREVAFSTFAVPTISGEIRRYFRDKTWMVRPPRDLLELSVKVEAVIPKLTTELGRQPTVPEIAERLDADDEEILEALQTRNGRQPRSLDAPVQHDEEDGELGDLVGSGDDGFGTAERRADLDRLMRRVTPRDRYVLKLRFEHDMTQAEIGEHLGVSQMQVSRIIRDALGRMRAGKQTGADA